MNECVGHSHDHDVEDDVGVSLRKEIDLPQVCCYNEAVANSGRGILKFYQDRFTAEPTLLSSGGDDDDDDDDDDEEGRELLLHVPFSETVSIKSICIHSNSSSTSSTSSSRASSSAPKTVHLFVNRLHLDVESAREMAASGESGSDMKIDLVPPEHLAGQDHETIDYPLRPAGRFQSTTCVDLFFAGENFGDTPQTEISYVGFKGRATQVKRQAVETVYETRGVKSDHKVPEGEMGARHFL